MLPPPIIPFLQTKNEDVDDERCRWKIRENKLLQQIDLLMKKNESLEELLKLKVR